MTKIFSTFLIYPGFVLKDFRKSIVITNCIIFNHHNLAYFIIKIKVQNSKYECDVDIQNIKYIVWECNKSVMDRAKSERNLTGSKQPFLSYFAKF